NGVSTTTKVEDSRFVYVPFVLWLLQREAGLLDIRMSFEDIERLLGSSVSVSDMSDVEFWGNDLSTNAHAVAWLAAGWRVTETDLARRTVILSRPRQLSFADILYSDEGG